MDQDYKAALWQQFGASIDMLENAIKLCPLKFWETDKQFWYMAYHCIFWLDYYLTQEPDSFIPPEPYSLSEFGPSGAMPDKVYSKEELRSYLSYCRKKCHDLMSSMTDEVAQSRWIDKYKDYSIFEILLYNMRHVQHHAAQLNYMLRQEINDAPKWVSKSEVKLGTGQ